MASIPVRGWLMRAGESQIVQLLVQSASEWSKDKVYQLGAALSYYAIFSMAPVLVITVAVVSLALGEEAARGSLLETIGGTVGPQIGAAIQDLLRYSHQAGGGIWTTILSTILLIVAATGLFTQIQEALNSIWDVKAKPGRGIWGTIKDRFWSFLMIVSIGLLVLLAVAINAGMAMLNKFLHPSELPGGLFIWQCLNVALSWIYLTLLFAALYKILPDAHIAWADVWLGAALTAFLFLLGNHLIGLYLKWTDVATTYGAAGSIVVILLWVYYSSQVLLFGAELTHIHAQRKGKETKPKENAERCDRGETAKPIGKKRGTGAGPLLSPNQSQARHPVPS